MSVIVLVAVSIIGCSSEVSTKPTQQTPQATPKPTPTPTKGSLENPADLGETLIVKKMGKVFEITVLDYLRGDQATQKVLGANMFNEEPVKGYEYLLVKVRVKYTEGEGSTYVGSFKAYVGGEGFDQKIIVWPQGMKDLDLFKKLLPGGQTDGWMAFIVPKGKEALLAYEVLLEPVGFIKIPAN